MLRSLKMKIGMKVNIKMVIGTEEEVKFSKMETDSRVSIPMVKL